MKKILVAITGGISAYKMADVLSILNKKGYETTVVMTENAHDFITPKVVGALSKRLVYENDLNSVQHIDLAQSCDLFLCAPATANIIGKFANGIADDFVSTLYLAVPKTIPKLICPAMNTIMLDSFAVQSNLERLKSHGCTITRTDYGMLACGYQGNGKLIKPIEIVNEVEELLNPLPKWLFPIDYHVKGTTIDSNSFLWLSKNEVEIPLYPHVGSFGCRRRHDVHRGVDLYCEDGTKVVAVEKGIVEMVRPWTGTKANCDWWEDTDAVLVGGATGLVVYGEIIAAEGIVEGKQVDVGDTIGYVKRVLKKDKGRPQSMLHLELRKPGFYKNIDKDWIDHNSAPEGVLDPTPHLIRSLRK